MSRQGLSSRMHPSLRRTHSAWLATALLALFLLPIGLLAAAPQASYAQSSGQVTMPHYDADITINPDGSLDVVETLDAVYQFGNFHRGKRDWPLDKIDSISNIRVSEVQNGQETPYAQTTYDPDNSTSGVPGTYGTMISGNTLNVRWIFPYISNGEKVFKISYHVAGVVRLYSDHDELQWYAIPPDWAAPIDASRVRVTLPQGTDIGNLQAVSLPDVPVNREGSTFTWEANNVNNGFQVGVKMDPATIHATKPQWQERVDQEERTAPLVNLGFTIVGLLLLVLGPLFVILRWYRSGRDTPAGVYADYVADAPSNLPPGLVGTLLDESADVRDVIATIVDQGRKGNLIIKEAGKEGIFSSRDFEYEQKASNVDFRYEDMVLNAIFKHGNPVRLSGLKNSFYQDLGPIQSEMYRTLVALKYFPESPTVVRGRNIAGGIGLMLLGGLVGFLSYTIRGDYITSNLSSPTGIGALLFTLLPAIGLGVTGLFWAGFAGAMPRKTDFGAGEAQKWRAFKRYLEEVQRYTNVQAAADKFQKYLPYAVALGVERQLINQFNSVPTAMPPYYVPYGWYPGFYPVPVGGQTMMGGAGGVGGPAPSFDPAAAMQGMSDSFAGAMQGMSDSFSDMVNSASSILTSQPQSSGSSGGGWGGGGGGFGGGSSGGGGGGFD